VPKMKRKPARKVAESAAFRDAVDFLHNLPEIREAFTRADIELALDDRGWMVPGRQWTSADLDAQTRTTLVAKSRLYWQRDPLAEQAVRLWTDYSLGQGISYKADDDGVQNKLEAFCKHRRNKSLMSSEGQRKSCKKLLIDGEVFFAVFTEDDGRKVIRYIDPLQITDIITDPDDEEHVLGYRRLTANDKVLYYADWRCDDDDLAMLEKQNDPVTKAKLAGKVEEDVVVYHHAFNTLLKRGKGLLFTACDWSKEHRRFMEARVAITQALSKFAWKQKVKGGQGIINKLVRDTQSSYAQSGVNSVEKHPQNAPGGTWVENQGMDLTPMPRVTGAGDSKEDGNQLKLMFCAATGVMLHYYGDPSTGNLATATAMELPMLKMWESFQQFWLDCYRDLFSIVLDEDIDEEPAVIDIDLPPILAADLQKLGEFLSQISAIFPELKVPEVLQMCLISLGVNNVAEVMKAIEAKRAEIDAQNKINNTLALARAKASLKDPNVNKGAPNDPEDILAQQSNGVPSNPESGISSNEAARLSRELRRVGQALREVYA
jgi:hypothetical protein